MDARSTTCYLKSTFHASKQWISVKLISWWLTNRLKRGSLAFWKSFENFKSWFLTEKYSLLHQMRIINLLFWSNLANKTIKLEQGTVELGIVGFSTLKSTCCFKGFDPEFANFSNVLVWERRVVNLKIISTSQKWFRYVYTSIRFNLGKKWTELDIRKVPNG